MTTAPSNHCHPHGYLASCVQLEVDAITSKVNPFTPTEAIEVQEFILEMFATDRPPFAPLRESTFTLSVSAIFGGINQCSWTIPDIPECYQIPQYRPDEWSPSPRLKLITTSIDLVISSGHGGAIASSDQQPIDAFRQMLDTAQQTADGFACLASLYALARLWDPPFQGRYISRKLCRQLRLEALTATWNVLTALETNGQSDPFLIEAMTARLGIEKDRWNCPGPFGHFFKSRNL